MHRLLGPQTTSQASMLALIHRIHYLWFSISVEVPETEPHICRGLTVLLQVSLHKKHSIGLWTTVLGRGKKNIFA